ncbi:MAG: EAL domain-containing protein [Sphingomonadales bacterium]|nr:EAL domain-containing protein [Sphingomonadales bacterium]
MATMIPKLRQACAPFRLATDDVDLLRAQFREFLGLIPLLYCILAANVCAVVAASWHIDNHVLARLVPAAFCTVALTRALWWWRRKYAHFSDAEIVRYMRSTSILAGVMAMVVVAWILLLYPLGTPADRSAFVFFIAITEIGCMFCLGPVRSAALSVAAIGIFPTSLYFVLADSSRMWVQSAILGFVGGGMVLVLIRHNRSFAELIHSQRDLRVRQLETERLSEENRHIALTDALSGLPNRRALIARLEDLHERSIAHPVSVAILIVDLDGFKQVNDTFGHEVGDTIIRRVSHAFAERVPEQALLFRMGGDEFAILCEGPAAREDARGVAAALLDLLAHPVRLAVHEFQLGASIGMAVSEGGEVDPWELLRQADTAMYRAKSEGGSGLLAYDPSMDDGRLRRKLLEAEIRIGLERGEFDVHYQPLVDAKTGTVVAVEALARWSGRLAGPLGPDEFIPIAESSGQIHALGLFVLDRACTELADWPDLKLNVNVSPAQFRHPRFEQEVKAVLARTAFPPERLQLEITEGYLIDNPDRANRTIASFCELGVRVALDDFGSGFASIGYLRKYPFSTIKIDRSLSSGLGSDPRASMLITGMVHLANGLDMVVTAEGVENERQAKLLRLAGCHELQGYHFGVPAPLSELGLGGSARARAASA